MNRPNLFTSRLVKMLLLRYPRLIGMLTSNMQPGGEKTLKIAMFSQLRSEKKWSLRP